MSWLINANQLDKLRKNPKNLIILDATWVQPGDENNPHQAFLQKHIIGARFLDLNRFIDAHATAPNMLTRDESQISEVLAELGITNEHRIIFYDNSRKWAIFFDHKRPVFEIEVFETPSHPVC